MTHKPYCPRAIFSDESETHPCTCGDFIPERKIQILNDGCNKVTEEMRQLLSKEPGE